MAYVIWAGISLTWTFSESLIAAFGYWVAMVLDVLIVIAMLKWDDPEAISTASLKGLVTGVYIIDTLALLFSATDEYGRLGDPEFLHPNALGHLTSLAALTSLFFWQRSPAGSSTRRAWGIGSIVLSWMIIRTLSKTSIVAFAVAALFSILLGSNFTLRAKFRLLVVGATLVIASYGLLSKYLATYIDESEDSATTLTGRTLLWAESWDMIVEQPVVGYGILSFRDHAPQNWMIKAVHGHNEWITQAFQLGFVGVFLTVITYWSYYRHFREAADLFKQKLGISIAVFILIEGIASAEPVGLLFPLPLLTLLSFWAGAQNDDVRWGEVRREVVIP
jgi:O-antigen ligase